MEQLLLHGIGDYITQTDKMAKLKTSKNSWAILHAAVYSLPFLMIGSLAAVFIIFITHFFIDRYRLARHLIFAKNWLTDQNLKWADCNKTGYPNTSPAWLTTWLMIITDNIMHLAINYLALRFF